MKSKDKWKLDHKGNLKDDIPGSFKKTEQLFEIKTNETKKIKGTSRAKFLKKKIYPLMRLFKALKNKLSPLLRVFEAIKEKLTPLIKLYKVLKDNLTLLMRLIPVIFAIAAPILAFADQGTDLDFTHNICTTECKCYYNPLYGSCHKPSGICWDTSPDDRCLFDAESIAIKIKPSNISDEEIRNFYYFKYANHHTEELVVKAKKKAKEKCKAAKSWTPSNTTCHCQWRNDSSSVHDEFCWHTCSFSTSSCSQIENKQDCEQVSPWQHSKSTMLNIRHSYWCYVSAGLIIGPSIITNLKILIGLLYGLYYKKYFKIAGWNILANIPWPIVAVILSSMSILQILPYLCFLLKIIIAWRIFKKCIDDDEVSKDLGSLVRGTSVCFTITEDLPQLTFQTMMILRAVFGKQDQIFEEFSWMVLAGLVTSCLSLSKNYTEYIMNEHSCSTSSFFIFLATFIASGGRALLSCLVTVIYPFTNDTSMENARYARKGYTWWMLFPISTAAAIQTIIGLLQFCSAYYKISFGQICSSVKQNNKSSCIKNLKLSHTSFEQGSSDTLYNDENNLRTYEKCIQEKLLGKGKELGSGIGSFLFSITIDSISVKGLWSSACYASWAIWTSLCITYSSRIHSFHNLLNGRQIMEWIITLATTAHSLAMISYLINVILVLREGKHRINVIIVTSLFVICPLYIYIMLVFENRHIFFELFFDIDRKNNNCVASDYHCLCSVGGCNNLEVYDKALELITITGSVGLLALLISIVWVVLDKVKSRKKGIVSITEDNSTDISTFLESSTQAILLEAVVRL